jgi:putative ABC transport system permease protein
MFIAVFSLRAPAAFASTAKASTVPATLGMKQILVGSMLVSTFGGMFMSQIGLPQLAKEILAACFRSTAQLFLLGGFMLQRLFGTTKPAIVWTWIVGVGLLAAQEASSRLEYTYDKLGRHLTISVLTSGLGILALSLAGKVFGDIYPWYQPRTLIPVAGMLFGNTLSATSLAASSLTREFAVSSAQVELRLSRGANSHEATMPIIKTSIYSALTPTVNSLAATGIIHMPGMMTGQVLSGQTPSQAAAYQVLILFLITSTACSTVQLLSRFISHELINWKEDRLQTAGLVRVSSTSYGKEPFSFRQPVRSVRNMVASKWFQKPIVPEISKNTTVSTTMLVPSVTSIRPMSNASAALVLKVDTVKVEKANMKVSFGLKSGERLGISGSSGIGKTQILRTLAGLEHCKGDMKLNGVSCHEDAWPKWRSQVSWVSQDRTTLNGTPREFFDDIQNYCTQKRVSNTRNPQDVAARWGLSASAFERPWSTLSGGEAQRASLAIALALNPSVLLLDEITAGLDDKTAVAVENTLASSGIPIVMVTHSQAQMERFCTHHMDLNEAVVTPILTA